ncbi:hypothetical protein [Chryseobacterium limigenitum]|uniref:Uncharacterized protein n=1 Tax=Chryseobacterium limigenitum TaxID=1612149 RepID=A0A1K2ISE6_9FLAO|nr:hypothetical protein [Chryseobacterium limigenitum]SFZ95295.1 hypothetical protein SAMN05216324_10948 [Chryseobacterium limigenitum]
MEKEQKTENLLQEFLRKIESLPVEITENLLKYSNDEDEKNIINTFAPTLKNQFKELSLFINEQSMKGTRQGNSDVEQFLKIASPNQMMSNMKIALPSIGSIVGKLGIDGIVKEIKKIIKEILGLFGINLPKWIDGLLTLIDEILNIIFGGGSAKMRIAMSQIEQHYLAELTQLAKLKKATKELSNDEENDEL